MYRIVRKKIRIRGMIRSRSMSIVVVSCNCHEEDDARMSKTLALAAEIFEEKQRKVDNITQRDIE